MFHGADNSGAVSGTQRECELEDKCPKYPSPLSRNLRTCWRRLSLQNDTFELTNHTV